MRIADCGLRIGNLEIYKAMDKRDLQLRTKNFALSIIKMADKLPNNRVGWTFLDQIVRSSTSVAANYRSVCRSKSDKDFISKMETVIEEADETLFWLEMIEESGIIIEGYNLAYLKNENNELISIFVASVKTVKNAFMVIEELVLRIADCHSLLALRPVHILMIRK